MKSCVKSQQQYVILILQSNRPLLLLGHDKVWPQRSDPIPHLIGHGSIICDGFVFSRQRRDSCGSFRGRRQDGNAQPFGSLAKVEEQQWDEGSSSSCLSRRCCKSRRVLHCHLLLRRNRGQRQSGRLPGCQECKEVSPPTSVKHHRIQVLLRLGLGICQQTFTRNAIVRY